MVDGTSIYMQTPLQKKCSLCKSEKPHSEFYPSKTTNDHLVSRCKPCSRKVASNWSQSNPRRASQRSRDWAKNNPDKVSAYRTMWGKKNKDKIRKYKSDWVARNPGKDLNSRLMYTRGITLDDYNNMLTAQRGVCAICKKISNDGRRLCVDHCHSTNRVRGLLCTYCNTAIGLFKDDVTLLSNAIKYLS